MPHHHIGADKKSQVGCFFLLLALYSTLVLTVCKVFSSIMNGQSDQNPSTHDMSEERSALGKIGLFILEVIKVALLAGVTIGLVRYFLFKPFYVKGQSMEPTYLEHEYLIVDEISYRFRTPERGEVVVFRSPVTDSEYYIKRVIGLPGERVSVQNNKVIIYNDAHPEGVVMSESAYLTEETPGSITVTLGIDEYFVMGDNRDASYDSRRFGAIHKKDIIGRTWLRGWPIQRISIFEKPWYNL